MKNKTIFGIERMLQGELLDDMIDTLVIHQQDETLEALSKEYQNNSSSFLFPFISNPRYRPFWVFPSTLASE